MNNIIFVLYHIINTKFLLREKKNIILLYLFEILRMFSVSQIKDIKCTNTTRKMIIIYVQNS